MTHLDFDYLVGRSEYRHFPDPTDWRSEVVAITGAGGSIGSALAEALARKVPRVLLLLDWCELRLTLCMRRIAECSPAAARVIPILANVTDPVAVGAAFQEHQPTLIFHAAAYKHISVLEDNVRAAVVNNVFGTKVALDCAEAVNARRFIFISTDKAADPVSVLGGTKRVGELLVGHASRTHRIATATLRFANVLGSSGSVYNIFKSQIEANKPITVTDPRASRYFVSVREAVQFAVWSAGISESGNVYTLTPGEEVCIYTLAERMLKAHGYRLPTEHSIACSALERGERVHEVLCGAEEVLIPTDIPFISRVQTSEEHPLFEADAARLFSACHEGSADAIRSILQGFVPTLSGCDASLPSAEMRESR